MNEWKCEVNKTYFLIGKSFLLITDKSGENFSSQELAYIGKASQTSKLWQ